MWSQCIQTQQKNSASTYLEWGKSSLDTQVDEAKLGQKILPQGGDGEHYPCPIHIMHFKYNIYVYIYCILFYYCRNRIFSLSQPTGSNSISLTHASQNLLYSPLSFSQSRHQWHQIQMTPSLSSCSSSCSHQSKVLLVSYQVLFVLDDGDYLHLLRFVVITLPISQICLSLRTLQILLLLLLL